MEKDLTSGKITPQLVKFTIPLILGNLFQLTYNAIDSMIAGKCIGEEALAAVGICNPITTLFILFLNGLTIGAGVLMGNQFGAKEYDRLHRQISTTMVTGCLFSLLLSLICIGISDPILRLMQVDATILPMATRYLQIIFSGMIFTFVYNCLASTMRALGDSRSPLYFLMISALVNVVGDLFFVLALDWGSEGCAIATVCSEALSCLLCFLYIRKKIPLLRLGRRWFVVDFSLLRQTISYGWASALQQATVQLGKLGIQAIVNTMGVTIPAAFVVVNRIDDFIYIPQQNIGHAMTSVMAQNKGAGKKDRLREAFRSGMLIEISYGIVVAIVVFFAADPLVHLFSDEEEVCVYAVAYLRRIAFFYLLPALTNGIQGYFRGIGDLKITLVSSFLNMGVRVVAAFVLILGLSMEIEALPYSYLLGWVAMLVAELPLLVRSYRK